MDWVLLGILTVVVLTGAALILLLIEPDVPGRDRVAAGGSAPPDEPAVLPAVVHQSADPVGGTTARDEQDLADRRARLRELTERLAAFEAHDVDRLLPMQGRTPEMGEHLAGRRGSRPGASG